MRTGIAAALLLVGSIAAAAPATRDDRRAAAKLTASCMAGHAGACIDLAAMGSRAGLDATGVITWHREACNLGDDRGCFLLASDLWNTGSAKARARAYEILSGRSSSSAGSSRGTPRRSPSAR